MTNLEFYIKNGAFKKIEEEALENDVSADIAVVNGKPVLCYSAKCEDCLWNGGGECSSVAMINWLVEEYQEEKKFDWTKVKRDTLVRVRDIDAKDVSLLRYFDNYDEKNDIIWLYSMGATSKTADKSFPTEREYCEIVEDIANTKDEEWDDDTTTIEAKANGENKSVLGGGHDDVPKKDKCDTCDAPCQDKYVYYGENEVAWKPENKDEIVRKKYKDLTDEDKKEIDNSILSIAEALDKWYWR